MSWLKKCAQCGKAFETTNDTAQFCKDLCRDFFAAARLMEVEVAKAFNATPPNKIYELPAVFLQDHASRDLDEGIAYISTKGRYEYVVLTDEAYDELLSDADFYADSRYVINEMGREFLGLSRSAKATAARLRKAGRPND